MTGIFLSETGNGERTQNPVRSFPTKILTTSVRIRKTDLVSEKRAGYRIIKDTIEMKTSRFCEGTAGFYIRTFLVGALEYNRNVYEYRRKKKIRLEIAFYL